MFTRVKNADVEMMILASNIKMATVRLSSNLSCAKYVVADKIEENKVKREAKKQERKENKEEKAPKEKKVKVVKEEKPKKSKEEKKQEKEIKKAENEAKKQERKEKRQEKKEKNKKSNKDSKAGSKTKDKANINVTVDVDDNIKEVIIDENGDIIVEAKIVDDSPENKKSSMLNQDEEKLVQGVTYGPDFSEFIVDEETDTEKEPEEKPVTQADLDAAIKKMLENGVK